MKLTSLLNAVDIRCIHKGSMLPDTCASAHMAGALTASSSTDNALGFDPEIRSIHYRSQEVAPGGLFVAIKGFKADGHAFIDEAIYRGASVVITQQPIKKTLTIIEVEDSRKALAAISNAFFGRPSEALFIIGVTGTNGKTTTAYLVESILAEAGIRVGVIGTINYRYSGKIFDAPVTTPEALDLQRILSSMRDENITHVVMEVSSHALDLFRVAHCLFDVAVFTNLSQDHLDYHKTMAAYWACKKRLFTELLCSGSKRERAVAVINRRDEKGKELLSHLTVRSISTGFDADCMVWPSHIKQDLSGITGSILTPEGVFDFSSQLVGTHNLENILNATGVGIALKLPVDIIKAGIEKVKTVPGRLERIPTDTGRFVYVDYAHTPDALENVLNALNSLKSQKMICVFGCGGDRDKTKRPLMGKIASRLCDLAIITSDNPRTEAPTEIIGQVLHGVDRSTFREYTPSSLSTGFKEKGYVVEADRRAAIRLGIMASHPGDSVLIAGKGHERYQIVGNQTYPFDDRLIAKDELEKIK